MCLCVGGYASFQSITMTFHDTLFLCGCECVSSEIARACHFFLTLNARRAPPPSLNPAPVCVRQRREYGPAVEEAPP